MSPYILSEESPYFLYEHWAPIRPAPRQKTFSFATYNVKFGEQPAEIARAIMSDPHLSSCDIIALQEIEAHEHEEGARAETIAKLCNMTCIYAPARNEIKRGSRATHGLAILTTHPREDIRDIYVEELPRFDLGRKTRRRIYMSCKVMIGGGDFVHVYNAHFDTRMPISSRLLQLKRIVDDIMLHPAEKAVFGGDINTIPFGIITNPIRLPTKRITVPWLRGWRQRKAVDAFMQELGFDCPVFSKKDYTHEWGIFRMKLDAIYALNMEVVDWGIEHAIRHSDHDPLWAKLSWK